MPKNSNNIIDANPFPSGTLGSEEEVVKKFW